MSAEIILTYIIKVMKFQIPPIFIQSAILLSCLVSCANYKINCDRYLDEIHKTTPAIEIQTIDRSRSYTE